MTTGTPSGAADDSLPAGWVAVQDEDGDTFYWNEKTDENTWTRPTAPALPAGWVAVQDEDGDTYYWNKKTDENTWTRPTSPAADPAAPANIEVRIGSSDSAMPKLQAVAGERKPKKKSKIPQYKVSPVKAWLAGLSERPVKLTPMPSDTPLEKAVDRVLNTLGVPMDTQLLPVINYRNRNLADFGCSLAVSLYFRIIAEAAAVFLVMFLLSVGAMADNKERDDVRQACRVIASDPAGHVVLTEGFSSVNVSLSDASRVTSMLGELMRLTSKSRGHAQTAARQGDAEAAAALCGYTGLQIYSFPSYVEAPYAFHRLSLPFYRLPSRLPSPSISLSGTSRRRPASTTSP